MKSTDLFERDVNQKRTAIGDRVESHERTEGFVRETRVLGLLHVRVYARVINELWAREVLGQGDEHDGHE